MADITVKVPDALIKEVETSHRRRMSVLAVGERTVLKIDADFLRSVVLANFHQILNLELTEQARVDFEEAQKKLHDRFNTMAGP